MKKLVKYAIGGLATVLTGLGLFWCLVDPNNVMVIVGMFITGTVAFITLEM